LHLLHAGSPRWRQRGTLSRARRTRNP
jgi:hypothetical protein